LTANKFDLGESFVKAGKITEEQLELIQKKQEVTGKRFEEILQEEGILTEEEIKQFLKRQYNIVSVNLSKQEIHMETPLLISEELARKYILFPFKKSQYRILVAMVDPYDLEAIEEVNAVTGLTVLPRKAKVKEIVEKINHYYDEKNIAEARKIVELEARRKAEEEARKKAEEEALQKAEEEAEREAEEEVKRKAEEEARRRAEEEARKKAEEEARMKAEEEARKKAEEEARRRAEEARRRAEEAKKKAEEEARRKAEEEARRRAEEEARRRAEEEAKRKKAEEKARKKAEWEAKKRAVEARKKAEEEAKRRAKEEAKRKAEEEARRRAEEARKRAEEEAKRKAEEEAKRKAEEEARKRAEEARKRAEEEAKRKAEEEAKRKAEEVARRRAEEARKRAEEEAKRKAEEEAKRKAEEEARRKAEEARKRAEEEAKRKAEEEAKRKAEEEARRKAEEARKRAEEEAKRKAEGEAKRKAEEEALRKKEIEEEKTRKKAGKDEAPSEEREKKKLFDRAEKKHEPKRARLGTILVEKGLISEDNLEAALKIQKETRNKLGEILVDNGLVQESDIVDVLSKQMGFPYVELSNMLINPKIPALIKENLARKHVLIPIKIENGRLVVAMADPLNVYAVDDIRIATGYGVIPYIAGKKEILKAIEFYYGQQSTEEAVEDLMRELDSEEMEDLDQKTLDEINNAPLVRLVNSLLRQAVIMKASDVHIEPFESYVRVRFRIDGDLQEIMSLDINTHSAVVARIKIMGKMDIAEKRFPQDGRVGIKIEDRRIDLRLSTLPTTYGEKIVIRILDRENVFIHKSQLGFTETNIERLDKIIRYPYGIILVTGPTGCGKTSTLYTVLSELNKVNRNIITVEDPVEFKISGINQVQVNVKANLTFANGLRSILRQDPDIIMIGEIRDTETVQIAVRAAITGHLVLSTMHTNDTVSTLVRLIDMGVESYLISNSVVGIVAQRLVKKICPECKEKYQPTENERRLMKIDESVPLYSGRGCPTCNNTGYKGRIAIAEIMELDTKIKKLIDKGESGDVIKAAAKEQGMVDLQENCRELVLNGITTIDEYIRNTYIL
jgi:type IV pilus assembly protein PilB